ncbi:unnamed protein product [Pieris brassicae]|uniref:Uncharacterized protein n=1 Tax=Pieris brassicae TaxID=7116 RepID=A0A9P0XCX7_PIEBR|nr:unnamed protein product [Pieris brassicae]
MIIRKNIVIGRALKKVLLHHLFEADTTDVIQCAVPIDIDTEKPGQTVRPIFMFIPYKKPLLSRKYHFNQPRYEKEDINNNQKVKAQDSHYIDDSDVPFIRAKSRHRPRSVGHGADIYFGRAQVAKNVIGHFMNDDVMVP